MPQKSRIHTASEKLTVLNLLEQSTATFQILFDCGPCKALELKKKKSKAENHREWEAAAM